MAAVPNVWLLFQARAAAAAEEAQNPDTDSSPRSSPQSPSDSDTGAQLRARAQKLFAKADVSFDGALSKSELKKLIQKDEPLRTVLLLICCSLAVYILIAGCLFADRWLLIC